MTDDCYWNHGTPKKNCYLCMDGENTVCPRCCVECCPTETPDWFARCAAAGHPPWPSVAYTVPRKLICLESSWDDQVFKNLSVKGFFDSLKPLIRPPCRWITDSLNPLNISPIICVVLTASYGWIPVPGMFPFFTSRSMDHPAVSNRFLNGSARMICAKPLPGMEHTPILFILDPAVSSRVPRVISLQGTFSAHRDRGR